MNTQANISHKDGRDLQNTSSRADHNVQEAPQEADQPINQEAANPAIQSHLAAAPANMVELEAERNEKQEKLVFPIFEYPKVDAIDRLNAAELIQDGTQRNAAYLSIVQDSKVHTDYRLDAAKLIKDDTQRNAAYLSIAQDPEAYILHRLKAAGLIKEDTQRRIVDTVYLSIAEDLTVDPADRLSAAKLIKEDTQRDAVYLSIAQDPKGDTSYRLRAAKLIKDNTQRRVVDTVYLFIAQCPEIDPYNRLDAAKRIKGGTQRDAAYLSIAEDLEVQTYDRLEATELIVDHKTQAVLYPSIIETILSSDAFGCMERLIAFVEGLPDAEIKDLIIKTICQNWPLVEEEQLQNHLVGFSRLYSLASDDAVRAELITAIVIRIDLDAGFREGVVKEHVKDPTEQERLLKVIEEKQEGSLNAPRTKRAR